MNGALYTRTFTCVTDCRERRCRISLLTRSVPSKGSHLWNMCASAQTSSSVPSLDMAQFLPCHERAIWAHVLPRRTTRSSRASRHRSAHTWNLSYMIKAANKFIDDERDKEMASSVKAGRVCGPRVSQPRVLRAARSSCSEPHGWMASL